MKQPTTLRSLNPLPLEQDELVAAKDEIAARMLGIRDGKIEVNEVGADGKPVSPVEVVKSLRAAHDTITAELAARAEAQTRSRGDGEGHRRPRSCSRRDPETEEVEEVEEVKRRRRFQSPPPSETPRLPGAG